MEGLVVIGLILFAIGMVGLLSSIKMKNTTGTIYMQEIAGKMVWSIAYSGNLRGSGYGVARFVSSLGREMELANYASEKFTSQKEMKK